MYITPRMFKSVEKLEDKCSDESSGEEGRITLSLSHLDSNHFLGSDDSEDKGSIQSVARRSVYAPRPPTRQSPRESVQSSRPPAKRTYPEVRARRARAREEDSRRGKAVLRHV